MTIQTIEKFQFREYDSILKKMFELRAKVFSEKLGWDVSVRNRLEKDRYDECNPLYIVKTVPGTDEVVASMRLLPTTGPTLLADVFADTMPDASSLSAPTIWECTRFCIDEDHDYVKDQRSDVATLTAQMMLGCAEICSDHGVDAVIANFECSVVRLYRSLGATFDILGSSREHGKRTVYLGHFPVEKDMVNRLKSQMGITDNIVVRNAPTPDLQSRVDLVDLAA